MSRPQLKHINKYNNVSGHIINVFEEKELPRNVRSIYSNYDISIASNISVIVLLLAIVSVISWKSDLLSFILDLFTGTMVLDSSIVVIYIIILILFIFVVGVIVACTKEIRTILKFNKGEYKCSLKRLINIRNVTSVYSETVYSSRNDDTGRTVTRTRTDTYYDFSNLSIRVNDAYDSKGDMFLIFIIDDKPFAFINIESIINGDYEKEQKRLREIYRKEDPNAEFVDEDKSKYNEYSKDGGDTFKRLLMIEYNLPSDYSVELQDNIDNLIGLANELALKYTSDNSLKGRTIMKVVNKINESISDYN